MQCIILIYYIFAILEYDFLHQYMKYFPKIKYALFPLCIILFLLILSFLNLNGSSVGIYNSVLSKQVKEDPNLIFGVPRAIRGDQFLVALPMLISQDINNEPVINEDMGEGVSLGQQVFPIRSPFTIFKPTQLPFLFSDNTNFSYALSWWGEFCLLIISIYLLLLQLTNRNLLISIMGSLIFLATPMLQWWNQTAIITWISLGLFFFLRLFLEKNWKISLLYGVGLLYSIVTFIFQLYPPFQIPVAYVAAFVALGVIINNWTIVKKSLKISIPISIAAISIAAIIILLYFKQYEEIINIITNTVYPGERFIYAGAGNLTKLFDGFFNVLLQRDSNLAAFGNQSESSNFFLFFPPLILWVIYKNILRYLKKKNLDWVGIFISCAMLIFTIFYFLPVPDVLSKFSMFYLVHPQRLLMGFGFGSYLLMFYLLSKRNYYFSRNLIDKILVLLLSVFYGVLIYIVGNNLYKLSPAFFSFPTQINYQVMILSAGAFSSLLVYFLLQNFQKQFLILLLSFSIFSTIYINPLYKGLDILTNTDLAKYIQEVSEKEDSKWVAYNHNYLAQYALANNASIINGIHLYPQFKIWAILDPEKKYMDVYNRYAHINISEYKEGEEYIRLLYPDALEVNISPCDEKWNTLNVKYIITYQEMSYSCLELQKDFSEYGIKIYRRNLAITQP